MIWIESNTSHVIALDLPKHYSGMEIVTAELLVFDRIRYEILE